ncbi:MAG: DUF1538 domain-containing protein [Clostridiales bacterium]|nr:DUF1538 domain-containing protein [Clostridiales bacterium]
MLKALWIKFKESALSVLPVALIVLILNCTPLINFGTTETVIFGCSAFLLILGIALFNLGADIAMTPMGEQIGSSLPKAGRFKTLLAVCFIMGIFITIAEPDLEALASQVKAVLSGTLLKWSIGFGVGIFLVLSVLKIVFRVSLSQMLTFFYLLLFALVSLVLINGNEAFLPLAFDSGGVTTGPITVPFIMALGLGVSASLGDKKDRESSFGFIALCSIGPILAVMALGIFAKGEIDYNIPTDKYTIVANAGEVMSTLLHTMKEVAVALLPIVACFFILQMLFMRLPRKRILQIIIGIGYTFFGLVIFLTAVNVGFMPIGYSLGEQLAQAHPALLLTLSFILGFTVVLAEPAIHVLKRQVETVTGGAVSKRSMLIALSVGVAVSITLSVVRIMFGFSILYYVIPGYFISLGLAFFVPKLYTAIAFDSGGVASGPLTSTFILPFIIGVCFVWNGYSDTAILTDAFGLVAMVAMTPLITIQALGFKAIASKTLRERNAMKRILDEDDEQIIRFM